MDQNQITYFLTKIQLQDLLSDFPYVNDMLEAIRLEDYTPTDTLAEALDKHPDESFTDYGFTKASFAQKLLEFIESEVNKEDSPLTQVKSLTIQGGFDKNKNPENLNFTVHVGEVICIVGPTGSGKSQLLEDIENLAQKDSPTGRTIYINGRTPTDQERYDLEYRLIAHLTQNMNFVIDLLVGEFIGMHAKSLGVQNVEVKVNEVIKEANLLSGEQFDSTTPITQLSGGQSRALMIADTALLSNSPIILIDEIENAGIDMQASLKLLVKNEKIVLISTHNPTLALMGSKRLILKNGAVDNVIETTDKEKENLEVIKNIQDKLIELRDELRFGKKLEMDTARFFCTNLTES